jgi:hypothetical protein
MKFVVKTALSGLINGGPWPEVGEAIDLPEAVGDGMPELERAKPKAAPAKKAAPSEKVEKRPASKAGVETREKK